MNVSFSMQQLGAWLGRLVSAGALIVSAVNPGDLPAGMRATYAAIAGVFLILDRYVTSPATGLGPETSPAKPAPPTQPALPPATFPPTG
jgi:hypothetical protein